MPPNDSVPEGYEVVQWVVDTVNSCAFNEAVTDLSPCYKRPVNKSFIAAHNYRTYDIRSILHSLRVEDYCHTSREEGKPDAYVFSPDSGEDYEIYLKVSIENGVIVISFHEPDRPLSFPFRMRRTPK